MTTSLSDPTVPTVPEAHPTAVAEAVLPTPLAELMSLDPLSLTRDDPRLLLMIEAHRIGRAGYIAGNKKAGSTKLPKTTKTKGPTPSINLGDIGL